MLNKTILKSLLNVKHTAIDDVNISEDGSLVVDVHPTKGEQCRCGICHRKAAFYDNGRSHRHWRACDFNTTKVYLRAVEPRVNCPEHGVVAAVVPWARHDSWFTYTMDNMETTRQELDGWIKWAQHCRIKVFVELQRKIRRHYDAILATIKYGPSNARIEAINNKIKLSIRMAYGFRNIENMLSMIMLRCSDVGVRFPWEY